MDVATVKNMTLDLLAQHGLSHWRFDLMDKKRAYGTCYHRIQTIKVNGLWLARPETKDVDVIDVIRHEVAHALTPGAKHNRYWKLKAIQLGATPKSCSDRGVIVEGKYSATCCGKTYHIHRRMSRTGLCPKCHSTLTFFDSTGKIMEKAAPRRRRPRYSMFAPGGSGYPFGSF